MNKKILSKLQMEKPCYYDCTESEAVVIQKSNISKIIRDARNTGAQIAALFGVSGTMISSLIALLASPQFGFFLGIDGPTWRAIFILIFVISAVSFAVLLVRVVVAFMNGSARESKVLERIFDENKKIR